MENRKVIVLSFTSLFLAFTLIVSLSYSWIARVWNPKIEETDLAISTTGALVIVLSEDASGTNTVNLKDTFNFADFVYRQVSSIDGERFFSVNYFPDTGSDPVFEEVVFAVNADKTEVAMGYGFMEFTFALKTQQVAGESWQKAIFLHSDTAFSYTGSTSADPRHAMRISICVDDGTSDPIIFGEYDSSANYYGAYGNADGQVFTDDNEVLLANNLIGAQTVHAFSDYNGYTDSNPDGEKILFSLNQGQSKWVRVRIWLEGADELCTDAIADSHFGLCLKFDSYNVLNVEE